MSARRCFFLPAVLILLAVACGSVTAQPVGKIVPNPKAVRLRELWRLEGGNGLRYVGDASAGLGIAPNGLAIWTVFAIRDDIGHWLIYHGGQGDHAARLVQDIDSLGSFSIAPIVGRFWGDGRIGVGLYKLTWDTINGSTVSLRTLMIYEMHEGLLADTARVQIDMSSRNGICLADVQAADLDGDGDDEVIVAAACDYPKLRIYKGGPEFNGDEPDKVITGNDKLAFAGDLSLSISDYDGDQRLDIGTWGAYGFRRQLLRFHLSSQTPVWAWDLPHKERSITVPDNYPITSAEPVAMFMPVDLDGDRVSDLYGFTGTTVSTGVYIWLSGSGRDFLTRPLDSTDYDIYLPLPGYIPRPWRVGPLNDSLERYDMLPLGIDADNGPLHLYSGGPKGPDSLYDAWAGESSGNVFLQVTPLPDVNGDGWPDMLTSYFGWRSKRGIAVIYAGGPEIPQEHTSGVREEPIAGEQRGLFLWPNPVITELNIAWRGSLKQMPHRFQVHDISGQLVAEGDIDPATGSALWSCGDVTPGRYILLGYDRSGSILSRSSIVRI